MTSLSRVLLLLGVIVTQGCLATLEIQPVTDDLEDQNDYFHTNYYLPHYITEKRSFIYPQYDVEKFALVPEAERDDKRDSIKGPSIDPVIQENYSLDMDETGLEESRALQTPRIEVEENGQKLSEITTADKEAVNVEKKKHRKISQKEKEAISAGLIKLLYDWKLHHEHGTSGSGSKDRVKAKHISGEAKEGIETVNSERKHSATESKNDKNSGSSADFEDAKSKMADKTQDPLSESKSTPSLIESSDKQKDNHLSYEDEAKEEDEGSTEITRRKSKGKINVLVNVNINERSLRSKVSHANKNKGKKVTAQSKLSSHMNKKEKEEKVDLIGEDDDEDDDNDNDNEKDTAKNEKTHFGAATYNTSLTQNNSSVSQNTHQVTTMMSSPATNTNYNSVPDQPMVPQTTSNKGSYPDVSYSKQYSQYPTKTEAKVQTTTNANNLASTENEAESSGDDDYDNLEERIKEDAASGSGENKEEEGEEEEEDEPKPKPAKLMTRQSKQRNAQIYLPGSMQIMTEKHEKKERNKEEESLESNVEQDENDQENEQEEDEQDAIVTNIVKTPKKESSHKAHHKKRKSKKVKQVEDKTAAESFVQTSGAVEKSTATPKFSKPKDNPKVVTKSSDNVDKLNRPQEATNNAPGRKEMKITDSFGADRKKVTIETQKIEKYGTTKNEAPIEAANAKDVLKEKEENDHFVKLHDSEIQLLKEHRARLQSSEPIVIDDIKRKHEKPKANPKEATKATEIRFTADKNPKQEVKAYEKDANFKPTTKRNVVTFQKPEVVIPFKPDGSYVEKMGRDKVKESSEKVAKNEKGLGMTEKVGSGDDEPKKYGSLKSVRERFKAWEKEMISRLSNPFLNDDDSDDGSGDEKKQDKSYKSWTDEEKILISKLSNPFLHKITSPKKSAKKSANKKTTEKNKGNNDTSLPGLKENTLNTSDAANEKTKDKSTAIPKINNEKPSEMPINGMDVNNTEKKEDVKPTKSVVQSFVPSNDEEKEENSEKLSNRKEIDLKQLEKFKEQISAEVGKINELEEEYKKNLVKSKDLENAKGILTKDLKYIKAIEKKLSKNYGKNENRKNKEDKEDEPKAAEKEGNIPKNEKAQKPTKDKQDPLTKIQSLLKAEMLRSKHKHAKGGDKQLENIRGLLKQELKKLIKSGKLGSTDNLPSGLKKLGNMIHQKLKDAKKKKDGKKKHKKSKKKKGVHGKELKNSLDLVKEYKPTVPGSNRGYITTMSKYKAAMEALKTLKDQQNEAASLQSNINSTEVSYSEPTKPHVVMPSNLPTGAQAEKFKDLLKNLNKKIGEVYTRLQSTTPGQQQNAMQSNQQGAQNNANNLMNQGNNYNAQPTNAMVNSVQQPQVSNILPQSATPITSSFNEPQPKHETPMEPEPEPSEEPEPDTVLAEAEPVETLIENLEKDITDVWSFKEQYPDAVSLGLDNEKIHKTYANLGSLSGLNLRRSLERALRGRDVGLAIVGGSISKGGPFSEKGVDYALKTYFYAIADWWNKVIRPITGSSMIIRDVSIGGIATDYYAYCLRSHLPDDRMTNIVLWELSANDMHRYDDELKPKQQSLEQFTQEVLSFKAKPALIYLNFFALFSWNQDLLTHCRNFEDEGEAEIAKHYKVTSLSWRDMVCSLMQESRPLFTRDELFAEDKFHPSIEAHAQMAYVIIDYIRTEFLKNLVKQRFLEIGDAARKLKIPETVYVPKPMYKQTFTWKPLCYTYMVVDNKEPNNTLSVREDVNGDFHYSILREFKIRSDKIIGMDTKKADQFITFDINVPVHRNGDTTPYKSLAIMSFTDDRQAEVRFDNSAVQKIDTTKKFMEGTVLKYIASNVTPGSHKLTIRSGPNGFIISAIMLG